MNILDISIDFETCALCPTAAVMSVGAVAWNRNGEVSPFFLCGDDIDKVSLFSKHVDLRSAFLDGFTFDQDTANWWSKQSDSAKAALLESDDTPLTSLRDTIESLFAWIKFYIEVKQAEDVCLWSQGSDFDIAILRNICAKYGLLIPVKYTNFRDHRTYFLEGARTICARADINFNIREAYRLVDEYGGDGAQHDPVFDCKRSIYSTWQMMQMLKCFEK